MLMSTLCAAGNEDSGIEYTRHYFQDLFQMPTNANSLAEMYPSIGQLDERLEQSIRDAIALNDVEIDRQLIGYLSRWVQPFTVHWPFNAVDDKHLERLKNIVELHPFLLSKLNDSKPHYEIYSLLSIVYNEDESVMGQLIEMGKTDDALLHKVIVGAWQSGYYSDKFEVLILKAITSDSPKLITAAATYLKEHPLASALPYLIRHLPRSITESDFQDVMARSGYFYVPPANHAALVDGFAAAGIGRTEYEDAWRSDVIGAILKYLDYDIAQYSEEILNAKENATFGPMSQSLYLELVEKIEKVGTYLDPARHRLLQQ